MLHTAYCSFAIFILYQKPYRNLRCQRTLFHRWDHFEFTGAVFFLEIAATEVKDVFVCHHDAVFS